MLFVPIPIPAVNLAQPIAAQAMVQVDGNGKQIAGPDPSIAAVPQFTSFGAHYTEAVTTDFQQCSFDLYRSNDLRHWKAVGCVFPAGHQPWWAVKYPGGRYWAPDIHYINDQWVVYYATLADPTRIRLWVDGAPVTWPTMVVGVAWGKTLGTLWQHTRILEYRVTGNTYGGMIDPSEAQDPATGQRWLFFAEQATSLWNAKLSADGLSVVSSPHMMIYAHSDLDCSWTQSCTVEGPSAFFYAGHCEVIYSVRSTWDWSYEERVIWADDPSGPFHRFPEPILKAGNGWYGPGGGSRPVLGPDGRWWAPFHAMRVASDPHHVSELRKTLVDPVNWVTLPVAGSAGSNAAVDQTVPPVPMIQGP
jgi:beta-xylosidase